MELTKRSKDFIEQNVLKQLGYDEITQDNIGEIVDYITDNFEVPLAQAENAGESIDKELLNLATDVITEITSLKEW